MENLESLLLKNIQKSIRSIHNKSSNSKNFSYLLKTMNTDDMSKIREQLINGTYKPQKFKENLIAKSKDSLPRVIFNPSLKDKAIIKILENASKDKYKLKNETTLSSKVIRDLKEYIDNNTNEKFILRIDIKKFFDNIQHDKLIEVLKNRGFSSSHILQIDRVLKNNGRSKGIPQGVSISSYLADLYLEDFDCLMKESSEFYARYVDDIIIIHNNSKKSMLSLVRSELSKLKLSFHEGNNSNIYNIYYYLSAKKHEDISHKFLHNSLYSLSKDNSLIYLGYRIYFDNLGKLIVTMPDKSINKFINSIINMMHKYKEGWYNANYGEDKALNALIYDINERITGAVKEDKKYGWLWYFNEINDLKQLDFIDNVIKKSLIKMVSKGVSIKRLKRTFYEINNFNPKSYSYILNYTSPKMQHKRLFLEMFSNSKDISVMTDKQVNDLYNYHTSRRVKRLHIDQANVS